MHEPKGQVLHGSARTTAALRRDIQHSQGLAKRYRINPKTVAKWRKRPTTADASMGPKPVSTVLSAQQQAVAVAFRRRQVKLGVQGTTQFDFCGPLAA